MLLISELIPEILELIFSHVSIHLETRGEMTGKAQIRVAKQDS